MLCLKENCSYKHQKNLLQVEWVADAHWGWFAGSFVNYLPETVGKKENDGIESPSKTPNRSGNVPNEWTDTNSNHISTNLKFRMRTNTDGCIKFKIIPMKRQAQETEHTASQLWRPGKPHSCVFVGLFHKPHFSEFSGLIRRDVDTYLPQASAILKKSPKYWMCLESPPEKNQFEFRFPPLKKPLGMQTTLEEIIQLSTQSKASSQALQQAISTCRLEIFTHIASLVTKYLVRRLITHEVGTYTIQAVVRRDFQKYAESVISYCELQFFHLVFDEFSTRTMQFLAERSDEFLEFCRQQYQGSNCPTLFSNIRSVFLLCSLIRTTRDPANWSFILSAGESSAKMKDRKTFKRVLVTWIEKCPTNFLDQTYKLCFEKPFCLAKILQNKYMTYLFLGMIYREHEETMDWLCHDIAYHPFKVFSAQRVGLLFSKIIQLAPPSMQERLLNILLERQVLDSVKIMKKREITGFICYSILRLANESNVQLRNPNLWVYFIDFMKKETEKFNKEESQNLSKEKEEDLNSIKSQEKPDGSNPKYSNRNSNHSFEAKMDSVQDTGTLYQLSNSYEKP